MMATAFPRNPKNMDTFHNGETLFIYSGPHDAWYACELVEMDIPCKYRGEQLEIRRGYGCSGKGKRAAIYECEVRAQCARITVMKPDSRRPDLAVAVCAVCDHRQER